MTWTSSITHRILVAVITVVLAVGWSALGLSTNTQAQEELDPLSVSFTSYCYNDHFSGSTLFKLTITGVEVTEDWTTYESIGPASTGFNIEGRTISDTVTITGSMTLTLDSGYLLNATMRHHPNEGESQEWDSGRIDAPFEYTMSFSETIFIDPPDPNVASEDPSVSYDEVVANVWVTAGSAARHNVSLPPAPGPDYQTDGCAMSYFGRFYVYPEATDASPDPATPPTDGAESVEETEPAVQPEEPEGKGIDWGVAIGSLAAVAAVAASLLARPGTTPDTIRYILQVGASELIVDEQGTCLPISVWAIDAHGVRTPASGAVVQARVSGPFSTSPLVPGPHTETVVTCTGNDAGTGFLDISATAGGIVMTHRVMLKAATGPTLQLIPERDPVLRPGAKGVYDPLNVNARAVNENNQLLPGKVSTVWTSHPELFECDHKPNNKGTTDVTIRYTPQEKQPYDVMECWLGVTWVSADEKTTATEYLNFELFLPQYTIAWRHIADGTTVSRQIVELPAFLERTALIRASLVSADGSETPEADFSFSTTELLTGTMVDSDEAEFAIATPDGLIPPVETTIEVKAWPAGTVINGIGHEVAPNTPMIAVTQIPVTIVEPQVRVDKVKPEAPIAANGSTADLELLLRYPDTKDLLPYRGPARVEVLAAQERSTTTLQPSEFVLSEHDAGTIRAELTTPQLDYHPDRTYQDKLPVYRNRTEGDTTKFGNDVVVDLAPALDLELKIEKRGLEWKNATLRKSAAERITRLRGKVQVEVQCAGRAKEEYDAVRAGISFFKPVEREEPVAHTDVFGDFNFVLPGLAEAETYEFTGVESIVGGLDKEMRQLMDEYDNDIRRWSKPGPEGLPKITHATQLETITYWREDLALQLAHNDEEYYDKIISAVELLNTAAGYDYLFAELHYRAMGGAKDALANLFSDIIGWILDATKASERLELATREDRVAVQQEFVDDATPVVVKAFKKVLKTLRNLFTPVIKLLDKIIEYVPGAAPTIARIKEMWNDVLAIKITKAKDSITNAFNKIFKLIGEAGMFIVVKLRDALIFLFEKGKSMFRNVPKASKNLKEALAQAHSEKYAEVWKTRIGERINELIQTLKFAEDAASLTSVVAKAFDFYPEESRHAMTKVIDRVREMTELPTDFAANRQWIGEEYSKYSLKYANIQQKAAWWQNFNAYLALAITIVQAYIMLVDGVGVAIEKAIQQASKDRVSIKLPPMTLSSWVEKLPAILSTIVNSMELFTTLFLAYEVAGAGPDAVSHVTDNVLPPEVAS
ncbi:MAG: hypothetical protein WAO49_06995 [Arcanobacterium sp.]